MLIGIHTLKDWGIIQQTFPLPPSPPEDQRETEVNVVSQGKKSTQLLVPPRRIFHDPDWLDQNQVQASLDDFKGKILANFPKAFSNTIDTSQVADVEPVKITLKDIQPSLSKRTTCKVLPYYVVGDAEKHIKNLVSQGILRKIPEPMHFCASSNFLRKPHGQGLCLVTDLCPLNSATQHVRWNFWSTTDHCQKIFVPIPNYSGVVISSPDTIRFRSPRNVKL